MKKNAMLKIAAVVLVAVLLTTCAISSTFAKYVSNGGNVHQEARVAKWGVDASISIADDAKLFDTAYGTPTALVKAEANQKANPEDPDTFDNLVAPGTMGSLDITIVVSGTPEVACNLLVYSDPANKTAANDEFLVVTGGLQDEIKWTLKDNGSVVEGCDGIGATVIQKINTYLGNIDNSFTPGQSTALTKTLTLSWEWAFDGADDGADTTLGDLADDGSADEITFNIYLDVVQDGPAFAEAREY